jgi:DNA invertase Pin-like site-specific DNA recombinase
MGKLMFQVTGAFAEFERGMIRQRIHAGLKRAVEAGKTLGRPRGSAQPSKSASRIVCGPAWASSSNGGVAYETSARGRHIRHQSRAQKQRPKQSSNPH